MSSAAPDSAVKPLGRSMRRVGNLLITISAITPAASVFIMGQQVTQQAGTGAIVCFLAAGLVALMTAFVYAELSSAFPLTGAEYSMMGRTMGPSWGFMALGLNLFGGPVSQAVTALGLADYLGVVIPGLPPLPVALAVTVGTALVGVLNVRLNAKITGAFLLVELAALGVMTALGLLHVHNPLIDLTLHPVAPTAAGGLGHVGWAAMGLGMAAAIYAYNGYGGAVYFGEEMYEARTKMAWVIFASLAVAAVAEFVPIVAVLAGAPDLKAVLTADQPYPAFLTAAGGPLVNKVVSLGVAFAIINAMIAIGLINARQLFCSGRDGVWPGVLNRWAAAVHPRFHSPWIATLVMGAATIACCFAPLSLLVILSGTNVVMLYAGVSAAAIAGRINGTTKVGHYRMPLYPLWPAAALAGLAGVAFADLLDPDSGRPSLIANLAVMAISAAYYLGYLKRRGGWALRGADGRTLEELEAEGLAGEAQPTMSAPP
ncbi:MAG TPA: APC family permease [Caulobacteraceae bacterium]